MNLFTYLKNLFNHHNSIINSNLVIPENIVKIPKRKDFHNNKLINFYKEEYLNILFSMHDYDTLILEADELNDNIKMTNKLLFNISLKEEIIKEKTIKDRLTYLINKEKLLLYQNDLINIQNEVTARLISLNEIRRDLFLNKRKKEALDNVINRLCLSLYILLSEQVGVINNINRYQNKAYYNYEPNNINEEYQVLDKIEKHLKWLQQVLPLDKQIIVNHDIKYIIKDLALIEKNLEEYTYQNKDKITKESKELELAKILEIPFDIEHKEEILKEIEKLEIKYRAFYEYREYQEYGELVIDESDLTNIYNLKFSALTITESGIVNIFVDNNTDELELSYYENIVFSLIQNIILGKNEIFNKLFYQELDTALRLFKNINFYKGKYTDKDALQDKHRLNFLLSLNNEDGLYNFFTNFKEPYPIINSKILIFDDILPLETICFIENVDNNKNDFYHIDINCYYLYLLYRKYYKPEPKEAYHIPKGIIEIREKSKNDNTIRDLEVDLINKIKKEAYGKKIYMPKSLKKIGPTTDLFEPNSIKELVLNEGLETICSNAFYDQQKITEINLPASIKRIEKNAFNFDYLSSIELNINKNNLYLISKECFEIMNFNKHDLLKNPKNILIHIDGLSTTLQINLAMPYYCSSKNNDLKDFDIITYIQSEINKQLIQTRNLFTKMEQVLYVLDRVYIRNETTAILLTDLEIVNNKLDEYVNAHEEEAIKIGTLINEIYFNDFIDNNFFDKLAPLENKVQLFNYYNKLNNKIWEKYYNMKYLYFTHQDITPILVNENTPFNELEFCQKLVNDKLKKAKESNDENEINNQINKLILNILKDKSCDEILTNLYLFNVFISLDRKSHLFHFCNSLYTKSEDLINEKDKALIFNPSIPFSTFCLLYYYSEPTQFDTRLIYNKRPHTKEEVKFSLEITKDLLELLHLIYTHRPLYIPHNGNRLFENIRDAYQKNPEEYYLLPYGIKEINVENSHNKILENMQRDLAKRKIITPPTLKVLNGSLSPTKLEFKNNIYLNEGLEVLDFENFDNVNEDTIIIPGTIKDINIRASIFQYYTKIRFHNFNFTNKDVLYKILDTFINIKDGKIEFKIQLIFRYDLVVDDIKPELDFTGNLKDDNSKKEIIERNIAYIEKQVKEAYTKGFGRRLTK